MLINKLFISQIGRIAIQSLNLFKALFIGY